jgi:DNA polymerase-1
MRLGDRDYAHVLLVDFEFQSAAGERPVPVCVVAKDLVGGVTYRHWLADQSPSSGPPFPNGDDCLFVAYFASADLGCYHTLGWRQPYHVLDLFAEFRKLTNGAAPSSGASLMGALAYTRLPALTSIVPKDEMRALALRGGPWTATERRTLLDYCEADVLALEALFERLAPTIDFPRAALRGRYMKAVASMEHRGIPVDLGSLTVLRERWPDVKSRIVALVNQQIPVFDGYTFKEDRWESVLDSHGISWPRHESGRLQLDDQTFRTMARAFPDLVGPVREVRESLAQLRLSKLAVGSDGRNRTLLSPFAALTGRNQPSASKFIFGPATWIRMLIKPTTGCALAYLDWNQQEFGIAAALSGDVAMLAAYQSGDPYLGFAKQAGAAPPSATRETHPDLREQFKACALGVLYGMGARSLGAWIGQPNSVAADLLRLHRRTYPTFWRWSEGVLDHGFLRRQLTTTFGWALTVTAGTKPSTLMNFPMQANGAECLRLACCNAIESGVEVCAPIHDALLIEASTDSLTDVVQATKAAMAAASAAVLGGIDLRCSVRMVRFPDRYTDRRGARMWGIVSAALGELGVQFPVTD